MALALAREIGAFARPCMPADRHSVCAQQDLARTEALRQEGRLGVPLVAAEGAARWARGVGRHGRFQE